MISCQQSSSIWLSAKPMMDFPTANFIKHHKKYGDFHVESICQRCGMRSICRLIERLIADWSTHSTPHSADRLKTLNQSNIGRIHYESRKLIESICLLVSDILNWLRGHEKNHIFERKRFVRPKKERKKKKRHTSTMFNNNARKDQLWHRRCQGIRQHR